ncbi:hypothetical protein Tco_0818693, partial [Tanacetum coccineum]
MEMEDTEPMRLWLQAVNISKDNLEVDTSSYHCNSAVDLLKQQMERSDVDDIAVESVFDEVRSSAKNFRQLTSAMIIWKLILHHITAIIVIRQIPLESIDTRHWLLDFSAATKAPVPLRSESITIGGKLAHPNLSDSFRRYPRG